MVKQLSLGFQNLQPESSDQGADLQCSLMMLKIQGPGGAWNKYSVSYLILYIPDLVFFFLKGAPKVVQASGPTKPGSAPATGIYKIFRNCILRNDTGVYTAD